MSIAMKGKVAARPKDEERQNGFVHFDAL